MKKQKLHAALAVAAAMGAMTACTSDDLVNPGKDEVAETDQTRYITVAISSAISGTRAGETSDPSFSQGVTHESEVTRLDFIFYDRQGNPTGQTQTFTGNDLTGNSGDVTNNPNFTQGPFENGNVTRIWTAVVPVELVQGENLPSQVICLVNAKAAALTNLKNLPLEVNSDNKDEKTLTNEVRDYVTQDDAFLMCNSTYYGTSELTGQPNVRICATPINSGQLYETREQAKNAIVKDDNSGKAGMVNIYVERLAAKVSLSMSSTAVQTITLNNGDETGASTVNLTFVPQYWFMNAVAKNAYITKRYGVFNSDGKLVMDATYDQIQETFTNYGNDIMNNGKWNSSDNHRSYWAISPSYAANKFPMVSDQVYDVEAKNDQSGEYTQKYYSFKEVKNLVAGSSVTVGDDETTVKAIEAQAIAYNGGFSVTKEGDHTSGYIYTRETTTAIQRIRDLTSNPAATVASAVIVGHYYTGDTKPEGDGEYPSFCVDRSTNTIYQSEAKAISALMARNGFIYSDATGETLATSGLVLMHPDAATRAQLPNPNIAGRLVTLQISSVPKQDATQQYFYYDGTRYVKVTDATTLAKANAQLAQGVGYLDMFNNGRAFFNIPVRHLAWESDMYNSESGTYNWGQMDVGSLGLVRNHVYDITVSSIKGLGTGLRSDDQPIVPPVETLKQYIAMRLNILSWKIANTWSVDL